MNIQEITSRQNPVIKWAASLDDKKNRDKEQTFLADGFKLFEEAIRSGATITHLFINDEKYGKYSKAVEELLQTRPDINPAVYLVSGACFEKISKEKSPQGVLCAIKYLDKYKNIIKIYKEEDFLKKDESCVFLASLRDPSNLGAIMRSAAAFGFDAIVMTNDCADPFNAKTARGAMGALFRLKLIKVDDGVATVLGMKEQGRRVFAAELRDKALPLAKAGLTKQDVVVIGNEGHGISDEISNACTGSVYIPIAKGTESLNASVAASLLLWEQGK